MIKTLLSNIERQKLFAAGETVVVAVSGGADSVALLDLLVHLPDTRLNLVVAHLNHSLRGADSDGDEEFVRQLAAGHALPFVSRRADVTALAASQHLSLEDAGRRARYSFFDEAAKAHGATSIALAHHLDDQAETVLMRLLRGSGGAGLSAMTGVTGGILKRPLLQISRADIEDYLKARGLTYRTDATNSDTTILRNSIRHELIPLLRKYNPNVSQRLAATAEILACDEELLDQLTATAFARVAEVDDRGVTLNLERLASESRGLRLRLYRRALSQQRGDLKRIGLVHLESIDRLVASERPNACLKLPGNSLVERCYGVLRFSGTDVPAAAGWELEVAGEGSHKIPGGGVLAVQRVERPVTLDPGSRNVCYLDPGQAPFPWTVRTFTPGDRFRPLGMTGEQKIKDLFINEKIPVRQRRRIPLVISQDRIIWIAGVKAAQEARVSGEAETVVRLEILDFTP